MSETFGPFCWILRRSQSTKIMVYPSHNLTRNSRLAILSGFSSCESCCQKLLRPSKLLISRSVEVRLQLLTVTTADKDDGYTVHCRYRSMYRHPLSGAAISFFLSLLTPHPFPFSFTAPLLLFLIPCFIFPHLSPSLPLFLPDSASPLHVRHDPLSPDPLFVHI